MQDERGLYVIRDVVADSVGPVFEARTEGAAKRVFADLVGGTKFPEDFILYRVGFLNTDGQCVLVANTAIIDVDLDQELVRFKNIVTRHGVERVKKGGEDG